MGGKTQTHRAEAENHSVCHQGSVVLIGETGDRRNCGHDLFDRQRDGNQSEGVQKAGRQEKKMVIGASAQFIDELSGRGFGARVVQPIQSDRR
jgi:hypothetical protein